MSVHVVLATMPAEARAARIPGMRCDKHGDTLAMLHADLTYAEHLMVLPEIIGQDEHGLPCEVLDKLVEAPTR